MTMRSNIKMGNEYHDGDALICPNCNSANLHQKDVAIVNRGSTYLFKEGGEIGVGSNHPGCDIGISFWCEQCEVAADLMIKQHKGTTYIEWEYRTNPTPMETVERMTSFSDARITSLNKDVHP